MTQEKLRFWLSFLLFASILLALSLVILGAILYLLQHGQDTVSYQAFPQLPKTYTTFKPLFLGMSAWDPLALILLGFLILVSAQILRVLILGFFFLSTAEYWLAAASFFIFIVLIYSMLWRG